MRTDQNRKHTPAEKLGTLLWPSNDVTWITPCSDRLEGTAGFTLITIEGCVPDRTCPKGGLDGIANTGCVSRRSRTWFALPSHRASARTPRCEATSRDTPNPNTLIGVGCTW